jgi:hypothetical protein
VIHRAMGKLARLRLKPTDACGLGTPSLNKKCSGRPRKQHGLAGCA